MPKAQHSAAASTALRQNMDGTLILKSANSPDGKKPILFSRELQKTKMPRELRGATSATPSREESRKPRHGRVAWLTAFSRLQWRDRGRISRPSPLPLPANCELSVCPAHNVRQTNPALLRIRPVSAS